MTLRTFLPICLATVVLGACGSATTDTGTGNTPPPNPAETSVTPTTSVVPLQNNNFGAMVRASDGGIWVAGTEKGYYGRAFLFKYGGASPNPCGDSGVRWLDELTQLMERDPIIQVLTPPRDGKFYVAGYGPGGLFVSRYLESNCQPDPGFGNAGHVALPGEGLVISTHIRVVEDSLGNLITANSNVGKVFFRRLRPDGTWDTSYGDGGRTANTNADNFFMSDIGIDADDNVYAGGSVEGYFAYLPAMLKIDGTGHIVSSFGTDGIQRYQELSRGTGGIVNVLVETDRLVVSGNTANSVAVDGITSNDSFIAAMDRNAGTLIPTFGTAGVTRWDWGFNNSNMVFELMPSQRGGYLTCGHAIRSFLIGESVALAEFTAQGQPNAAVGYQGRRLVVNPDPVVACLGMAYDGNGKLFLGVQDSKNLILTGVD